MDGSISQESLNTKPTHSWENMVGNPLGRWLIWKKAIRQTSWRQLLVNSWKKVTLFTKSKFQGQWQLGHWSHDPFLLWLEPEITLVNLSVSFFLFVMGLPISKSQTLPGRISASVIKACYNLNSCTFLGKQKKIRVNYNAQNAHRTLYRSYAKL